MAIYDLISENNESTVVAEFEQGLFAAEAPYMSERNLEDQFVAQLGMQEYEYLSVSTEDELIMNLRKQLEVLNGVTFTDSEWKRFFNNNIAKPNSGIVEKTRIIQEDPRFTFNFDNGDMKNIMLLDKQNIHQNSLQVMRQYTPTGGKAKNRYDVTILVNGLPLVHVELKKPGVDIREAFNQIKCYGRESFWADCGLFEYVQIYVISNGTFTKYYSNTTRDLHFNEEDERAKKGQVVSNSFEFTSWWTDARNKRITMLEDFTKTFFAKHTILNLLTHFCVFTVDNMLMVMRPYQIAATENILKRIKVAYNNKLFGSIDAGGYIWHTTGSGKTLTSFKTSLLASKLPYIDKVLFVVDRKDLDYQTMREYDNFQKDAANSNTNVSVLERQLNDATCHIIITTIQKLSILVKRNKDMDVYNQHVVMIFDECHRSQFGEMHTAITKKFKKYYIFGFTGTPIFSDNANMTGKANLMTTQQVFGERLHTYTIINAISDQNVLPFHLEYIRTMREKDGVEDAAVEDIDRERIMRDPKYISNIVTYIIKNFGKKTKRNSTYQMKEQRLNGFNSIFATASIDAAKLYYQEFKRQMAYVPEEHRLKVAMIYSYGANEADPLDGELIDENPEDTSTLSQTDKDALQECIDDYNQMFGMNFDLSSKGFQDFYKDVSKRMKNRELDLLIVVNMFLTGFDAKTLNTLWVDKNLKMHGLLQAYSRTNRILNSVKNCGNIICFRNLEQATNDAIGLFGNSDAQGIVMLRSFEDYYEGYTDSGNEYHEGYEESVKQLREQYPLPVGTDVLTEESKKDFIRLYSYIMRLFNILNTFDAFEGKELLGEQERQHYASTYIELYYEFKNMRKGEAEDVNNDIAFEMELIKQDEISIDRILWLIQEYAKDHMKDMEIIAKIRNAVNASPDLRNKKDLIERFIEGITPGSEVDGNWEEFIKQQKAEELQRIIVEENLKPIETRNFMEIAFRNGFVSMSGTSFAQILPAMSRFAKDNKREEMRQRVYEKLCAYLEKFKGLGNGVSTEDEDDFTWEMPEVERNQKQEVVTSVKPMVGENGGMKALGLKQPWASLLASGITKVENRDWITEERGTFLIAATNTKLEWDSLDPQLKGIYKNLERQGVLPAYEDLPTNVIIGYADFMSIVDRSNLPGTNRKYAHHFVIKNPHVFDEPIPNHVTGSKFYEVTEIKPENLPASHQVKV